MNTENDALSTVPEEDEHKSDSWNTIAASLYERTETAKEFVSESPKRTGSASNGAPENIPQNGISKELPPVIICFPPTEHPAATISKSVDVKPHGEKQESPPQSDSKESPPSEAAGCQPAQDVASISKSVDVKPHGEKQESPPQSDSKESPPSKAAGCQPAEDVASISERVDAKPQSEMPERANDESIMPRDDGDDNRPPIMVTKEEGGNELDLTKGRYIVVDELPRIRKSKN